MTPTLTSGLSRALSGARCLLLDFDGPVCDVFAGEPADKVAETLLSWYQDTCGTQFAPAGLDASDPLEIVRRAGEGRDPLAKALAEALTRAELSAVKSATLTPGAQGVMRAWYATGWPVCVVSNNSADAVRVFLALHELDGFVSAVVGRPQDVSLMKPDPYPIHRALQASKCEPSYAVMVGDSVSDIEAAQRAGTRSLGFANRPEKLDMLVEAGAGSVITSMQELLNALPDIST